MTFGEPNLAVRQIRREAEYLLRTLQHCRYDTLIQQDHLKSGRVLHANLADHGSYRLNEKLIATYGSIRSISRSTELKNVHIETLRTLYVSELIQGH